MASLQQEIDMNGKGNVTMTSLVRDTIREHGLVWAAQYYAKRGLPFWQFLIFAGLRGRGLM